MQKNRICYREFSGFAFERKVVLGLGSELGVNPVILPHYLFSQSRSLRWATVSRRIATLLDGCLQGGYKHLTWCAIVYVLFHFLAKRIVQLLVEILRQFSKQALQRLGRISSTVCLCPRNPKLQRWRLHVLAIVSSVPDTTGFLSTWLSCLSVKWRTRTGTTSTDAGENGP